MLAVRDAFEHWRYYFHGSDFTVQKDHSSLQHVLEQPKLSSRQICLLERLQECNAQIEYLPGAQNYIQDALSCRPGYQDTQTPVVHSLNRLLTSIATQNTESRQLSKGWCSTCNTSSISGDILTVMTVNTKEWLVEV